MADSARRRQQQVIELLKLRGYVGVRQLAQTLGVSEPTVRKDLAALERQGLAVRTHGGAVLSGRAPAAADLPFARRADLMRAAKEKIGRFLAELVQPGETVIFDSSSTVWYALPFLVGKGVTIVSNVAGAVQDQVAQVEGVTLISTGGMLRPDGSSFCGPLAEDALSQYWADRAFISPVGVSLTRGYTHANILEARVRRRMMQAAERVYICADHSKFGEVKLAQIAPLTACDAIITDQEPPDEFLRHFRAHGIEVHVVDRKPPDADDEPDTDAPAEAGRR